jgi:DNA-binding NarL/FixJ family response regulator
MSRDYLDWQQYELRDREQELVKLIAEGLNNKEIAAKLYLGEGTVRNTLSIILDKLQLRDRTQLAIWYYKQQYENDK